MTAGSATGGTLKYSKDGINYSTDIPTAIYAGTYTVYYRVDSDNNHNDVYGGPVSVTISQLAEETPSTDDISFNYTNEVLTGFEKNVKYSINDNEVISSDGTLDISEYIGQEISIVRLARDDNYINSGELMIEIPARPEAPTGVIGGRTVIVGVTDKMEYKLSSDSEWTDVTGTNVMGLAAGSYDVRIKATENSFASEAVTVTVAKKKRSSDSESDTDSESNTDRISTYTPIVKEGEGGSTKVSPSNPAKGDTVTVTPKAEDGYEVDRVKVTDENDQKVKVTDNGDGTYSFTQPDGKVTIETVYKETETEIADEPENEPDSKTEMAVDDVKESDWFYDAVQYAYENGMMSGTGENSFSPYLNTTRGMIATILYRMSGESYTDQKTIFSDVKVGMYYNTAIAWGVEKGIISGYDDGLFRPEKNITREELAVLIYNYAKYKGFDVSNIEGMAVYEFTDYEDISDWAMTAVRYCLNAEFISGRTDGSFDPKGYATRAEVASVIMRVLEK